MYSKKTWVDRNVEHPSRRKLSPVSGENNIYDVVRAEGTITDPGDAFNAETMNDLENRIDNGIGEKQDKAIKATITLGTTWTDLTQSVSVSGILASHNAILDIVATTSDFEAQQTEWSKVYKAETYEGGIKFYAKEATTVDLTVQVLAM